MDKLEGFRAGADDYIVKPFDLDELGARVEAHLRREQRRQCSGGALFGELVVDYAARTVVLNGSLFYCPNGSLISWSYFHFTPGQVFDRERIYETVWGIDGEGNSDTIMEHIRKIRAKFAVHTLHSYIETVWGVGINGTAEKMGLRAPFLWCLCSAWRQPCC